MLAAVAFGLVSPFGADAAADTADTADDGGSPSQVAQAAVAHAKAQVGKPYRFGGSGPKSFDCSGLVQWSYQKAGKALSRTTFTQFRQGSAVERSALREGDLVFFHPGPTHVGIYVGGGSMVHAPRTGRQVEVVRMSDYFDRRFVGARRVA
ncbi:cell wall-associated NlpC family hydrolase [Nocardiopsis mwathae]|uniref:Cell wall-associated NlpC family hydrolase n=1 Tax=Nocardiopsis mwathae TaxID=1472723 RepID=A0A7W9YKS4_9ACTN|nr:C40 family peptidase [Nocardiopsis mwathae]MBB6173978.1 cell wall-associated NlpC family hydrolase [Nocardiopsis mwathae]